MPATGFTSEVPVPCFLCRLGWLGCWSGHCLSTISPQLKNSLNSYEYLTGGGGAVCWWGGGLINPIKINSKSPLPPPPAEPGYMSTPAQFWTGPRRHVPLLPNGQGNQFFFVYRGIPNPDKLISVDQRIMDLVSMGNSTKIYFVSEMCKTITRCLLT